MKKGIRTGVYAILKYKDSIVVIKKGRGPFTGMYDMPGGKIEHGEENYNSLQREIQEETGLAKGDFIIEGLLCVEEDFLQHTRKGEARDEHLIGIIYIAKITTNNFDLSYVEEGGDANGMILMKSDDAQLAKTNILKKALKNFKDS